MVQEAALSYFSQHDFTIVSVQEPDLMASDPSRIADGRFFADDRSMIIAEAGRRPGQETAREGPLRGSQAFGYYEGEQKAVERMRALRKRGLGVRPHCSPAQQRGYSDEDGAAAIAREMNRDEMHELICVDPRNI
jgi:hypothetical protein